MLSPLLLLGGLMGFLIHLVMCFAWGCFCGKTIKSLPLGLIACLAGSTALLYINRSIGLIP
jgi:hypothetical protein